MELVTILASLFAIAISIAAFWNLREAKRIQREREAWDRFDRGVDEMNRRRAVGDDNTEVMI